MTDLRNLHILIAEDDLDDGEFVQKSFSKHPSFAKVTWVKNGKELLDYLENGTQTPDIILTDINMPVINGLEVLEKILKSNRFNQIPVFTYSSTSNPFYEEKSKELGSLAFLVKPYNLFDFDEIPREILYILDNKSGEVLK